MLFCLGMLEKWDQQQEHPPPVPRLRVAIWLSTHMQHPLRNSQHSYVATSNTSRMTLLIKRLDLCIRLYVHPLS